jgi:hypothetical protein
MNLKFITSYSVSCFGGVIGMYSGFKINDILYKDQPKKTNK